MKKQKIFLTRKENFGLQSFDVHTTITLNSDGSVDSVYENSHEGDGYLYRKAWKRNGLKDVLDTLAEEYPESAKTIKRLIA